MSKFILNDRNWFPVALCVAFLTCFAYAQFGPSPIISSGGGGGLSGGESVVTLTPWASGPTGSLDMKIGGYSYSITANSAITSFVNTRSGNGKNFVDFDLTNGTGGDLTFTITASGYLENDGARTFTITNKSQREIRFSSSAMGVRGISQPWF